MKEKTALLSVPEEETSWKFSRPGGAERRSDGISGTSAANAGMSASPVSAFAFPTVSSVEGIPSDSANISPAPASPG
ncbi:hypothetical protein MASR1M66_02040 [Aminivibrio sp.]